MPNNGELYHFGIPGMRWGHKKSLQYTNKAKTARASAREWDQMAKYAQEKGKIKKAEQYHKYAKDNRREAYKLDKKAAYLKTPEAAKKRMKNQVIKTAVGVAAGTAMALSALKMLGSKKISSLTKINKINLNDFKDYVIR